MTYFLGNQGFRLICEFVSSPETAIIGKSQFLNLPADRQRWRPSRFPCHVFRVTIIIVTSRHKLIVIYHAPNTLHVVSVDDKSHWENKSVSYTYRRGPFAKVHADRFSYQLTATHSVIPCLLGNRTNKALYYALILLLCRFTRLDVHFIQM